MHGKLRSNQLGRIQWACSFLFALLHCDAIKQLRALRGHVVELQLAFSLTWSAVFPCLLIYERKCRFQFFACRNCNLMGKAWVNKLRLELVTARLLAIPFSRGISLWLVGGQMWPKCAPQLKLCSVSLLARSIFKPFCNSSLNHCC